MIQLHGLTISNDEAAELASRLRSDGGPLAVGVAERLERGLLSGTAIIGLSRPEAKVVLGAIASWVPARLRDVARDLRRYLSEPGTAA